VIIQTFWAFPVLSSEPEKLIFALRKNGFDATRKISLKIVGKSENQTSSVLPNTKSLLAQIVFLPMYPEMPFDEIEKMAKCLKES